MKQVNVLMDEMLLEHVEKIAQIISLLCGKKVTTSDVVRQAVIEYSKYGQVIIESKLSKDQILEINCKLSTLEGENDEKLGDWWIDLGAYQMMN
jgi:hypothetical protein